VTSIESVASVVLRHRGRGFWFLLIPLALVIVGAIVGIVEMVRDDRKRKELIAQGIDPDTVPKKAPILR
jgi:hypothetical protein